MTDIHDEASRRLTLVKDDGADILDAIYQYLGEYVAYPSDHARIAHTAWIAHTHAMDAWDSTPRIAFLSPEPGSGKTRALELTETLVPHPVEAVNVSPAYLFRKVSDENVPTILFDEIDTIFGPRAKDNEEIRGMLNAGHRRGATAGRCVVRGQTVLTEELPAYCAVALAGLGNLPDTILTRSIVIRMRRRSPSEKVKPYRRRIHALHGNILRDRLSSWVSAITNALAGAWPDMPPGIEDRNADVWESLFAIADAAGGDWPEKVRVAAVALVAESRASSPSLGVNLLSDLRDIFETDQHLSTKNIIEALIKIEESPWGDLRGKPLDERKLSRLLRPYSIKSKNINDGLGRPKGYAAEDLYDAWQRYLPAQTDKSATAATSATSLIYKDRKVADPERSSGSVANNNIVGADGSGSVADEGAEEILGESISKAVVADVADKSGSALEHYEL